MRVLVTGHNGYVGTIMMPLLAAAGHDLVGLDTNLYIGSTFGDDIETNHYPMLEKDVRDVTEADLDGFEAIIHLAGLSNDPLGDLNPELTFAINYRASVHLANLAKRAGVERFVFASSCSNYGAGCPEWLDETSAFNPVTPYGISKVKVEQEVSGLADDDFSPTFLRSATAYGVSPRLRFDLVLNNLTAWAYTTGQVFLKSDGQSWRPIVHIEDMARAFLAVLQAPRELIHNESFNVGSTAENYQIAEIAEIVAAAVPGSQVVYADGAGPDKRCYKVNCDKITQTLDFQTEWNARRGAKELFEAYQMNNLQPKEFEGPRYRRIHHVKYLLANKQIDKNLRWLKHAPS